MKLTTNFLAVAKFLLLCLSEFPLGWSVMYNFSADQILDRVGYKENCSGNGRHLLGRCRCDRLYHGARCEIKEECVDDADCGILGTCVDHGGTTVPTKQCYCNAGWFGPGCAKSKFPFENFSHKLRQSLLEHLCRIDINVWLILISNIWT